MVFICHGLFVCLFVMHGHKHDFEGRQCRCVLLGDFSLSFSTFRWLENHRFYAQNADNSESMTTKVAIVFSVRVCVCAHTLNGIETKRPKHFGISCCVCEFFFHNLKFSIKMLKQQRRERWRLRMRQMCRCQCALAHILQFSLLFDYSVPHFTQRKAMIIQFLKCIRSTMKKR